MTIEFTLDELNEIYDVAFDHNYREIVAKIETKYTRCYSCYRLVLNEEFEHHYNFTCPCREDYY
ncbi:hypothetical protein [Acinetobacter pollinis]|uniref:hypothetical protein n=1 Tax=Acinetobacter pollinis TaxID=2605270 RepID=UPI001BB42698|nr:hypothetical protein [Acinetobacter pollinis]